ncbi:formate--tetrahydrofolate ligase, partial [Candidatus Sumerlaeota bacterium]|nr:formate--tetrahydrofolate ligase [Candidatus Sumerlaeota bacterium]
MDSPSEFEFSSSHELLEFAEILGVSITDLEPCGRGVVKTCLHLLDRLQNRPDGKYVLVTAMNPTTAGEGKTVTTIGLSMALNSLGRKAIATLREPSMGPVFGKKGGATGGGKAFVTPREKINLHFTGDMHAVTSAHNLLAAFIENSLRGKDPIVPIRALLDALKKWAKRDEDWRLLYRQFRTSYAIALETLRLLGGRCGRSFVRHILALFSTIVKKNALNIDPLTITWRWAIDLNARPLRNIEAGLRETQYGFPLETGFDITPASEVMAILALSNSLKDLRERLSRIVVAETFDGRPVTAGDIGVAGPMSALLADAIKPNVVLTSERTAALIHAGPFGNIAHGSNSIIADKIALKLADYVVTEAGFGTELGAEKFFDIKCRISGLRPDCAVIVCSLRAIKLHSGEYRGLTDADLARRLRQPNPIVLRAGFANLARHIENIKKFGLPAVVAINRFDGDSDEEIEMVRRMARESGADEAEVSDVYTRGSEGGLALAEAVIRATNKGSGFRFLYEDSLSIREKIEKIAREIYGARDVEY